MIAETFIVSAQVAAHVNKPPRDRMTVQALAGHAQQAARDYVATWLPGYTIISEHASLLGAQCLRFEAIDDKQQWGAAVYVRREGQA